MEKEKMTAAEVQQLRERAERERARHEWALQLIFDVEDGTIPPLSIAYQMEIVKRMRESEIMHLLDVYLDDQDGKLVLSDEAQMFIYENGDKLPKAKEYLIKNYHLSHLVEARIFRDDKPLYMKEGDQEKEFYPRFSPEGEEFMVKETLVNCRQANRLTTELYFLQNYTKRYELSALAQGALMDFLTVSTGRDSTIDTLEAFVIGYIAQYQKLEFTAQMKLIRSGNHKAIMYYIEKSLCGIVSQEVVDELIARGDREEITAYFNRYAYED